jgi:uncharacterized protein (TIGR02246 family)
MNPTKIRTRPRGKEKNMRKISLALSPTLLALMAVGCQPPPPEMAPERTVQEVEDAFDAVRTEWEALANADDAAAVAAFYTEDAVFVDAYGNVYNGRAAIQGYLEASLPTGSGLTIQKSDMVFHGDIVATSGTFSQMVSGPEGEETMTGLWQTVSFFQPDGSILIRMHQSMLPAEPPPEMPEM